MAFNLLSEAWLPVERRSGKTEYIPPWQLTQGMEGDPIQHLGFLRPDLGAATLEWLIGLFQTLLWDDLPKEETWQKLWKRPPSPELLREKMAPLKECFELINPDGPAFMQDFTPEELDKESSVEKLFLEIAGQKAAFFVKEEQAPSLCPSCATAALHMLQIYAPAGGAGVRTGLRGGGPLSTIIQGDTLWHTVCANLLSQNDLASECDKSKPIEGGVFPWMATTRVSDKRSIPITPGQVHPLHVFWAMPRRMRLLTKSDKIPCMACGSDNGPAIVGFRSRHHGNNYEGAWDHPLSAVRIDPKSGPISIKGKAFSGFRDWLGLVFTEMGDSGKGKGKGKGKQTITLRRPAKVVSQARKSMRRRDCMPSFRLRACGFDMDKMKPLAWVDEIMPVRLAQDEKSQRELVRKLVSCAENVREALYAATTMAVFDELKNKSGGTLMDSVNSMFWARSQPIFDQAVSEWLADPGQQQDDLRRRYIHGLQEVAVELFNAVAVSGASDDTQLHRQALGYRLLLSRIRWPKAQVWVILDIEPTSEVLKKAKESPR